MTKGTSIFLAALGGAALAAIVANYLTTEKGRQLLNTAGESLREISDRVTEIAKNTAGEVLNETKNHIGTVVKDKIAEQTMR